MISEKNKHFAVLALAFALRVVGIGFGLPHLYHQDEMIVVNHAMAVGASGWNPHFFVLPPLSIYFLFMIFAAQFAAGKLLGVYPNAEAFASQFLSDPTPFYLLGRFFLGVLFGTAAVFLLYRICLKSIGRNAALLAALFLAVAYLPAAHSHYIYADSALVFFCLGTLWAFLRLFESNTLKNSLLFSAFIALSTAAKYTAVYFLPSYLLIYLLFEKKTALPAKARMIIQVAAFTAAIFAVLAPYTFLDWTSFWSQIRFQSNAQGHMGYAHHLTYSLANGIGGPAIVLAAMGATTLVRAKPALGWLVVLQIFFYYGVNIFFTQPFARYMLPLVPLVCILAGFTCDRIPSVAIKRALIAGVVLSNLVPVLYLNALFFRGDTRDECKDWVEQNLAQGSVIVRDNRFFTPHILQTPEQIRQKAGSASGAQLRRLEMRAEISVDQNSYEVYTLRGRTETAEGAFLSEKPYVKMIMDEFKKIGAQYLIVNYSTPAGAAGEERGFLEAHRDELERMASFSPFRSEELKRPLDPYSLTAAPDSLRDLFSRKKLGPYLEVYRIKDA